MNLNLSNVCNKNKTKELKKLPFPPHNSCFVFLCISRVFAMPYQWN